MAFGGVSVGVVVLLDVLEHLADPVQVLQHARRTLVGGWCERDGAVNLYRPAYPWLYGDWDKRLGHYSRYTTSLLRDHATQAAFASIG